MVPAGPLFHKPQSFLSAKNLIYTSICVGLCIVLLHYWLPGFYGSGLQAALALIIAGYILMAFFVKQAARCKKWARTAVIVACILVNCFYLLSFKTEPQVNIAEAALVVLQAIFQAMAIIFLFTKESNIWFNSRTTEALP